MGKYVAENVFKICNSPNRMKRLGSNREAREWFKQDWFRIGDRNGSQIITERDVTHSLSLPVKRSKRSLVIGKYVP